MIEKFRVTEELLNQHPNWIFVYGDNTLRRGTAGAAALRHHPRTYGFITKRYPNNKDDAFYTTKEYKYVFEEEFSKLLMHMAQHDDTIYVISPIGAGLANKHRIWEEIIEPGLKQLCGLNKVLFTFEF